MSEVNELWRKYKTQADDDARQQLITRYAYLAKYVIDRMLVRPNSVMSYEDLLGHAVVGLIEAVERFDPARGVKFETYAIVRIRGAALDAIKSLDWTPRSVRSSEQELRRAFAELEARLGRPATDAEIAAELNMNEEDLSDALAHVGQSALLSLEDLMVTTDDSANMSALAGTSAPFEDPILAAELDERKRFLAAAIDSLPEREKLVISLYYKEELTLKEIAAVLGVTESRACQLHSKAIVRLNGKLARHKDLLLAAA
ncbi:MAG: FliA/WhiG family RNA polymerase sigma factor [Armatimonadota bacterium]|nr:FliA/WhiG family RNA polymerase sigma factor [Armatimonadota bacterium]